MRLFLLLFLTLVFAQAAEVTTTWGFVQGVTKYHVYGATNNVIQEFATVDATKNTIKFNIKAGVPYRFYVTAENKYFIESVPSTVATFTYPIGIPPQVLYVNLDADKYGYVTKRWFGLKVSWAKPAEAYAITEFLVHYETKSQTNIYTTRTNFIKLASVPVTETKIYVEQVNLLGKSPIGPRGIATPNERRPEKISGSVEPL